MALSGKAKFDIAYLETALEIYRLDVGEYPSSQQGLAALVQNPGNAPAWRGPYLARGVPVDPWGRAYLYVYPGRHNPRGFDLSSLGPDGKEAGADDINNWTKPATLPTQ